MQVFVETIRTATIQLDPIHAHVHLDTAEPLQMTRVKVFHFEVLVLTIDAMPLSWNF